LRALLLAAGLGTRLRPITETVPKCMVPILGRPLLDIWLDLLLGQGIERVMINTHYLADRVKDHVTRSPWAHRTDIVHEESLLGTGGTVLANAGFFGDGPFLVAHADNLTQFDLKAFVARHMSRPEGAHITMMTFDTDTPETCGIVELDETGLVTALHEKVDNPPGNRANGAIYLFDQEALRFLRGLGKPVIDLSTEVLPHFVNRMNTFHNAGYFRDIGSPKMLQQAERDLVGKGWFAGDDAGVISRVGAGK